MKKSDFGATRIAPSVQFCENQLLCGTLRSPVEVSFLTPVPQSAADWIPVRSLWHQNRRSEACAAVAEIVGRSEPHSSVSIPAKILMAHMRLEVGDTVGADRCLQAAFHQLGNQTELTAKWPTFNRYRVSTVETTQPYAMRGRDWLIMAIHALLKNDLESCLQWIQQTDRRVFEAVAVSESPQRLRLIGDVYAVLACVATQSCETDHAEKFLATAYERHVQAEAFESACRDLILTSRLASLQGQSGRARSLLDVAECQLLMTVESGDADRSPLMEIIHTDRMLLTSADHETHDRKCSLASKWLVSTWS